MRFKPNFWGTVAVILLCPLFIRLGFWQLDRGEEKHHLHSQYVEQQAAAPLAINADNLNEIGANLTGRKAQVSGRYLEGLHVLLDNQTHAKTPGYRVYTPFQIRNTSTTLWISRGWLPLTQDRAIPPDVSLKQFDLVDLQGVLSQPPTPGIRLGETPYEALPNNVTRVQMFDLEKINREFKLSELPYVLRVNNAEDERFAAKWPTPGSGEQKHYGYAFQWFSFATAVVVLYLIFGFKRQSQPVEK
ncbi:MAG: SURF1 family protein [Pseudomonadota bacterium]